VAGAAIDWQSLPAKVEGVIEKRIERLEEALQEVLTIASVEGEFFTAEIVARVQQVNERGLVRQLSHELDKRHRLVTAQALEWLGQQRLSRYRFRHHLFQHYLYYDLDEIERAYLHEEVGNVLEALYGDQTEKVAVQLARHFQEAGITEKAVNYLLKAGQGARLLSANEEAIELLNKGLVLLETLPSTPERAQQELEIQIAFGNALIATRGYATPEAEKSFARARELCQQVGETVQLFSVLHGLARFYLVRTELQTTRELGEQLLRIAQSQKDPVLFLSAHQVLGATLWFLGEFVAAQEHFEQGITLYNRKQHHSYARISGEDQGVVYLSYASSTLWLLGYPDQALKWSHEALSLAQDLTHPLSMVFALNYAAILHKCRQEWQATQERIEAAIALADEQGFVFWSAFGKMALGWALAEQGQGEKGIALLNQNLITWQATGAGSGKSYFSALLVEVYAKMENTEAGLEVLADALTSIYKGEERLWEAELHRLKGELLLMQKEPTDKVEANFHRAIDVARQQNAKSLELRATVSLSRLWQEQGKEEEACQMLADIYGWFTEGFDTADLKGAKALLEELS
jgi:predicted ATPase